MAALNLSFAACGFVGIYHLGAVGALLSHCPSLTGSLRAAAGASAGALVAAVVITAPDKLQECRDFTYSFADSVRQQPFGAVTPGYDFMLTLREGIDSILPPDADSRALDRLHVSLTHYKTGKSHIVSKFNNREELLQALLASSFVPVYAGLKPVEFRGEKWVDGGFTDSLPILPFGRTITVSPFSGPQDVCPVHRGRYNNYLRLANMNIMFSLENLKRLNRALFPPSHRQMKALHQGGHEDAMRFIQGHKWTS